MKTYVITLSKRFLATHPKRGKATGFASAFKQGRKIHTIRTNYELWEKRIKEVQEGKAVLSVRQWTDRPYMSPQKEIAQLTAADGVGVQWINLSRCKLQVQNGYIFVANIEGINENINIRRIAMNDGFNYLDDFLNWFDPAMRKSKSDKYDWETFEGVIIHFTKFRY